MKKLKLSVGTLFLCFFSLSMVVAQVSGTIYDENSGQPLIGATITVQNSGIGTITDIDGNFSVDANSGDILDISYIGYGTQSVTVGDQRSGLLINLAEGVAIDEVVVTGYSSQRKRDITGAVSVVDVEELNAISASSFTQKLEGRASGVTISTSGEPGEGTTVRIRGISSFQNNDPLYIIDGVPVQDAYQTGFNPNDIESIQVLKDAASASIYGARANNGVIIVTTKQGGNKEGKTQITYDAYVASGQPARNMDYMVSDPKQYSQYVWDRHENAGLEIDAANPYSIGRGQLPQYIFPFPVPPEGVDESSYSYPNSLIIRTNPEGTNWFDEVFEPALSMEHNLGVSGGGENGSFYISGSYLDQNGSMIHNKFDRMSLRANTSFQLGKVRVGENFSLARSNRVGQDGFSGGNQDEQGIMTFLTLTHPLIPVHDVSGENAGGAKASGLTGTNAVYANIRNKDNKNTNMRLLGNVFAEVDLYEGLTFRTSYGVDYTNVFFQGFSFPSPEARQPNFNNGFSEGWQNFFNWTWTNTLSYKTLFQDMHDVAVLVGYEAIKNTNRSINGGINNYFTQDINAWYVNGGLADPDTRSVGSFGGFSSLLSTFAKVDYTYDNKIILSGTIRRDGSSNFGDEKYGIFPAASVGIRLSEFAGDLPWLDDLKLRAGWGVTGNQSIPGGNSFARFGGSVASTFYDIGGTNNSLVTGYALTNRGNAATKWEENVSTNIGLDGSMWNGKLDFVVDVYSRTVDGLLFPANLPGTSGTAAPAFVNIASMKNNGIDIGLNHNNRLGSGFGYDLGLTFTSYRNEVVDIDGSSTSFFPGGFDSRIGIVNFNQIGSPISSFYGWTADGVFQSQAEVDAHADQSGKAPGRLRFKDLDGDGVINDNDKGIIGHPHPDFTLGFNLGASYGNFDFNAFLFASVGNEVFNYQKLFDVFSFFNSNVRKDVVTDSWTPSNPDAEYPINDLNDIFSISPSTFYVEDASYLRAKNIQLGYTFGDDIVGSVFSKLRLYVQAQNLFTITGYSGLDPSPSNFGQSGLNGDLWYGYDFGNYPTEKKFLFGVNAAF